MAAEYSHTDAFRGASFTGADFTGAKFRDCDLRQVKIVDSWLVDVNVSGLSGNFVVNDVDVTAFVEAELERRHPERVQLRQMQTADDYRAMWDTIERLWSDTVARAERLPEPARDERVDDEWSFVETLRHLVFAVDVWVGRMVLGEPMPYHRLGRPPTDYPTAGATELGIDLDARSSYAAVVALHADRRAQTRGVVEALTDTDLEQIRTAAPAPAWGVESHSVGDCLSVVMREHYEHRRSAVRDIALLEAR
jgi:hypothetical protein